MEKQKQHEALTLEEKKERWIHTLRRKLEMRTLEEWDLETMSETVYQDDVLEFYRECQEEYVLTNVHDEHAGVSASLDDFFEDYYDLGDHLHIDALRGMTFMDYMAQYSQIAPGNTCPRMKWVRPLDLHSTFSPSTMLQVLSPSSSERLLFILFNFRKFS